MYCTGDLGQWESTGNIKILGRRDDQVKVKVGRLKIFKICDTNLK